MADQKKPVYFLAIDLGTSVCKASVISLEGEMKSLSCTDTPREISEPEKWINLPEKWWQATIVAIRKAILKASISPKSILGIGLCAFMHTPIGLDSHGSVVTPTMIWSDTRSNPQAIALRNKYGKLFREITGDDPRYNHTAVKIRWLVDNFPDRVALVRHWVLPKDYLRYKLTGLVDTDVSDAIGTLLYDPVRQCWDEALVDAAGTSIECMPEIGETLKLISYVSKYGSRETGLIEGTPVIGCADGYAALIGANGCADNRSCLYLGTSAWITRYVHDPCADPRYKIVPSIDGYHQWIGAVATAGASLDWVTRLFGTDDIAIQLTRVASIQPGADGLFFLPHLAGERGPIHNPNAKGALIGLRLGHSRSEIYRAVLEGVAFQIALALSATSLRDEIDVLTIIGGGANSNLWVQIIADILNKSVEVPVITDAGLLGTAALTGSALGILGNPQVNASGMFRRDYLQEPDPNKVALYSELFRKFTEIDSLLNK